MSESKGWCARRLLVTAVSAVLVAGAQVTFGAPVVAAAASGGPAGRPNRVDLTAGTRSLTHLPGPPPAIAGPRPAEGPPRVPKVPMRPALVIGADGTTALPARTFGYTSVTQYYEDVAR